jgi:hypothetical protein
VIDKLTVELNDKGGFYEVEFTNLGLKKVPIDVDFIKRYTKASPCRFPPSKRSRWPGLIPQAAVRGERLCDGVLGQLHCRMAAHPSASKAWRSLQISCTKGSVTP